ncbi:hypothetical protein [Secundilactobacillus kimchicus]|uniref:hypothetical protein n=1 Tax=Secundilactobacillus kimchicus TaxID=528209 RepID=UPI0024A8063C|nr:hypothetical protein [Secundilactobacillus kimchicus]
MANKNENRYSGQVEWLVYLMYNEYQWPVKLLAEGFGVSRSTVYNWIKNEPEEFSLEDRSVVGSDFINSENSRLLFQSLENLTTFLLNDRA